MELEVLLIKGKSIGTIKVQKSASVKDLKVEIHKVKKNLYPERQAIKVEANGKTLNDADSVQSLGLKNGGKIFVKDLGPQIGWSTVFLCEYAGPLATYLWFYPRPWYFYGAEAASQKYDTVVHIAAACWSVHYIKRLLETLFVHRFSHATMPIMNLFKNCAYYWGFAAFVAYFINHPLYTPPCCIEVYGGLAAFILCELGNFSIHIALRNLRPAGTSVRRIPHPTKNPFTFLFKFVSCPNYTYEIGSWISFAVMSHSAPALIFAITGGAQMAIWALGKHRNYKKEFSNYPKQRKAIIPFIL